MPSTNKKSIKTIVEKIFGAISNGTITIPMNEEVVRKYIENEMRSKGLDISLIDDYCNIFELEKTTVIKI